MHSNSHVACTANRNQNYNLVDNNLQINLIMVKSSHSVREVFAPANTRAQLQNVNQRLWSM